MENFHGNFMGMLSFFCSNLLSNAIFPANLLHLLCGVLSVGGAVPHQPGFFFYVAVFLLGMMSYYLRKEYSAHYGSKSTFYLTLAYKYSSIL